jgi:hypothetical protein
MEIVHSKKIEDLPYIQDQLSIIQKDSSICDVEGLVSFENFTDFVKSEIFLVEPIAKFVNKLKRNIIGEAYWGKKAAERDKDSSLSDPNFLTKLKLLVANNLKEINDDLKLNKIDEKKKKNSGNISVREANSKVFEYLSGGVNPNMKNIVSKELKNVKHSGGSQMDSKIVGDALVQRRRDIDKPRERRTTVRSGSSSAGGDGHGGGLGELPKERRPTVNNGKDCGVSTKERRSTVRAGIDGGLDKLKPLVTLNKPSSKMTLPPISSSNEKPKERRSTKITKTVPGN